MMLNIFSCAYWLSACPLWKNVYLGLLHIFKTDFFILSCISCLYILDINPLLVISFATTFPLIYWVWLGPICLFFFYFLCFKRQIQKNIAMISLRDCSACFPLGVFIVFSLTFRSLIHRVFIFAYGVRECSDFILLHVAFQFHQHTWRDDCFFIWYPCLLCHRLIDHQCAELFLGSLFCSVDLCVWFCTSTILL